MPLLESINSPSDLRQLSAEECAELAGEIRTFVVEAVTATGGHLGSNLGAVELTIALHRVFDSPEDVILFDTGHQAYVHKILTGRKAGFARLRQADGLSGYPRRAESPHDVIENSHASTALSWAHGIATGRALKNEATGHHVVAVVGDGALTGGMAYEALNNLGHASAPVLIVLNDNGRSYAPTVSKLSGSLTQLSLDPRYLRFKGAVRDVIGDVPVLGQLAERSYHGFASAVREAVEPHVFFEALGVRYIGPYDGHDIAAVENALRRASTWTGPVVVHLLTKKGKGYAPAEEDEIACLHDLKVQAPPPVTLPVPSATYTDAFTQSLLKAAAANERIVAITAAMPGPTGLLTFEERYPERFFDVGIAEQHAMTMAAGLAREGLRPVLCVYSTFLQRCVDQWNLDVGLHKAPVVVVADRAGVTGDDGPSHHGIYDLHSALSIPALAVYCPAEPNDIGPALESALSYDGPSFIRYPKTPSEGSLGPLGEPGRHRVLLDGDDRVVIVGIGKMARRALEAARIVSEETGLSVTVLDPRVIRPADEALVERCARAELLVTVEDGIAHGGAGRYLAFLADEKAAVRESAGPRIVALGVPVSYHAHGRPDEILSALGLDGPGIATAVVDAARRFGILGDGALETEEPISETGGAPINSRRRR